MAQQQARDEAGNIWYIDDAGNPIGLAQAAPQGGASVVASNPVQAQRQGADLTGANLGNQKTAQQIALEAAKVPFAPRQAAAETTKAETEAQTAALTLQKAQREAALPVSGQVGRQNLQRAIDDIRAAYTAGPGRTSGVSGLADYLPTTANQRFDAAGNSVRGFVGPALGLTGGQLNTEKEAQRAVGPYIPQAGDRDAVIEDKIRRLQGLADAMGGGRQAAQQRQQQQALASGGGSNTNPPPPGGSGPAGYDVAGVEGGVGGGGGGGTFASAAGVAMAQRLKAAYNRGANVQQLNKLLQDNGFQPLTDAASIAAIQKRGPISFAPPQADDTRGAFGRAIGAVADTGLGAYAISAGDALTAGTLDNIAGGQAKLAQEYAAQKFPTASLLGTVTGGALAAGGAELGLARAGLSAGRAALAGDALYGGAYGAGSADGEGDSRLLGGAVGAAGGALGGVAGRAAARGIGGALTGVQNADVRGLRAAGVPLTAGQVLGGAAKGVEDRLSGVPVLGNVVNARRLEGMQGFNRAAFDEGLAPIAPQNARPGWANNGEIREQGIDAAQMRVGDAYDTALDPVQLQADLPFTADMRATLAAGEALPEPMAGNARYTLNTRIGNSFDDTGGLSGRDFQQSIRGLRRDASAVASQPYGYDFGQVTRQGEAGLEGLLERQSPGTLPAYNAANQAFRRVEILRDAVNRARNGTRVGRNGVFAPSQLTDAAAANAKKFGNSQGTTRQPFFDLTRAGQSVLPNSVPDSGTAGRLLTQQVLAAGGLGVLGGGGGYVTGGEDGAQAVGAGGLALGALLAAGGSRFGQRQLTRALLDRPEVAIQLGRGIQNRARLGGIFGAPLLAGAAPMLAQ